MVVAGIFMEDSMRISGDAQRHEWTNGTIRFEAVWASAESDGVRMGSEIGEGEILNVGMDGCLILLCFRQRISYVLGSCSNGMVAGYSLYGKTWILGV